MSQSVDIKFTASTDQAQASIKAMGNTAEATTDRMARAAEKDNISRNRQTAAIAKQTKAIEEQNRIAAAAAGVMPKAAAEAEKAINLAAKATHEFSSTSAGAMREYLVLFHEGIQGNFKRMAGSAVVLGERMNAMKYIFSGAGVAVGAAAGAIAALAIATEQGWKVDENFRRSMVLTGGAAGITAGQFRTLGQTIAAATGRGVKEAEEALQSLVSSGQVAPQNLGKMGTAIVQISHLTGEATGVVAKQFDEMAADVVGWIQRHKEYANSLTASQLESIRQMQKTDDIQGAVGATLDAINKKTQDAAGFWARLGTSASNAWTAMGKGMGGVNTPEDKLGEMQARLAEMEHSGARGRAPDWSDSAGRGRTLGDQREGLRAGIAAQAAAVAAQQQAAALRGATIAKENDSKAAHEWAESILKASKDARGLNAALDDMRERFKKAEGSTKPFKPEEKASIEASIRRTHRDKAAYGEENAYESTLKSLTDEDAKLKATAASWNKYGKAVDESREAVMRARLADVNDKVHAFAGTPKGEAMLAKARVVDTDDNAAKEAESIGKIRSQVQAYRDLTQAKELDAKAAFIAQALTAHGLDLEKQGTDEAKKALAADLAASAASRYDAASAKSFETDAKARQERVKNEVDAIHRQNDALHQTTLQREIAAAYFGERDRRFRERDRFGAGAGIA
jgi:phage-related minor tail protein